MGLISKPYHNSGPEDPFTVQKPLLKAFMSQRFMHIQPERSLAEKLAENMD
jgi:hypothetical protein